MKKVLSRGMKLPKSSWTAAMQNERARLRQGIVTVMNLILLWLTANNQLRRRNKCHLVLKVSGME